MARGKRAGRRAGPRRPAQRAPLPWGRLLLLALGVTLTVVAWGYLVLAAIDFGSAARGGDSAGWAFLAVATLGAVACLFVALVLAVRAVRLVGGRRTPPPASRHSTTGTRSS
ncbi:hypothetical protein GCM10009737_22920 [Nocardioides lentus]|uniref:Uncharacterized protein n=1 Tax=Nocardioides lentus TaxID=338077 RepID=A0ABP5ARE8_9ACTN